MSMFNPSTSSTAPRLAPVPRAASGRSGTTWAFFPSPGQMVTLGNAAQNTMRWPDAFQSIASDRTPGYQPKILSPVMPLPAVPTPEQLSTGQNSAKVYFELGNNYYEDSKFPQAVQAFSKVIELSGGRDYLAYHRRANARANLKDYAGAVQDYTMALRIKPDFYNAYNNRGNVKTALQDYRGAWADYTQAIRLAPLNPVAYENRSELYTTLGQNEYGLQDKAYAIQLHRLEATTHTPPQGLSFVPKRFALVLGNDDYDGRENDLGGGPVNDTRQMSRALGQNGFDITSGLNMTAGQMRAKIAEFTAKLKQNPGAVALIYYSGHGGSINGSNYLLSTDFNSRRTLSADQKSVSIDYILEQLKDTPTYFNILFFDACRTPLMQRGLFNIPAGAPAQPLPPPETVVRQWETEAGTGMSNVWIEYASRPMMPAMQYGSNGLYTKYLLQYLNRPDLNLKEVSMYTSYALDQDPIAQREGQHARTQTDLGKTGPMANAFYFTKPYAPMPVETRPLTYAN